MEEDIKKKYTLWLHPDLVKRMDAWLRENNCKSRSEFTEKALRFYLGYISSSDVTEYLSKSLTSTLEGMLADNENRLRSLVFKGCVELNMALHMLAAHFGVPESNLRELRAYAVDEVKRTNGQIKLDNAVRMQRRGRWEDDAGVFKICAAVNKEAFAERVEMRVLAARRSCLAAAPSAC